MNAPLSLLDEACLAIDDWQRYLDPDWYRAAYNLAAGLANEAHRGQNDVVDDAPALQEAHGVVLDLLRTTLELRRGSDPRLGRSAAPNVPVALREHGFLDRILCPSITLLAGVCIDLRGPLRLLIPVNARGARHQFDELYDVVIALDFQRQRPDHHGFIVVKDHLIGYVEPSPSALQLRLGTGQVELRYRLHEYDIIDTPLWHVISEGRTLNPVLGWLVSWVRDDATAEGHEASRLTHYNLACLYAAMADLDRAFQHLARALIGDPRMIATAIADPVLEPLRQTTRWDALIHAERSASDEPPETVPA